MATQLADRVRQFALRAVAERAGQLLQLGRRVERRADAFGQEDRRLGKMSAPAELHRFIVPAGEG